MKYRSVQVMRALAAMLVVVHHVTSYPLGAAGVDLFFVLSGFIITTVAPGEAPIRFLAKRAARIYPIYWVCQAPYFIYAAFTAQLSIKLALASLTLISFGMVSRPVLLPGWTLMFEVYFYLAVAFCLATKDYKSALLAFLVLLIANEITGNPVIGFFGHPLVLEFLAGALIVIAPRSIGAALAGLIAAGIILRLMSGHDMAWGWIYAGSAGQISRSICWGIPAALIVYASLVFEGCFRVPAWSPLVLLGDASYALYLTHSAIVSLQLWWPMAIGLSVVVALVTHLWIEKPLVGLATKSWVKGSSHSLAMSGGLSDSI